MMGHPLLVNQLIKWLISNELPERTKIQILAPVVRGKKGQHKQVIAKAKREGYVRVQIDGTTYNVDDEINLIK